MYLDKLMDVDDVFSMLIFERENQGNYLLIHTWPHVHISMRSIATL